MTVLPRQQPRNLGRFIAELINMVAGLLVWVGHFAVVYGIHAVSCARGLHRHTLLGWEVVPAVIAAATAAALLASAAVLGFALRDLRTMHGRGDFSDSQRFLTYTSASVASFSMLAIIWVALPALIIAPCA
ncbi:MAG: hypothetical protein KIS79_16370 [Burkholderiales bacterium]|nr:hypothetical protein [Burkholderiales bacterium]